jgi:hypothetical protein
MKQLIAIAVLFCLSVPAALAAPPAGKGQQGQGHGDLGSGPNPSQLCQEQLRVMGGPNFRSAYAPTGNGKNAFGKCVSRQTHLVATNTENAAKACKSERASMGVSAFNEKYGPADHPNKRNAFGRCVSGKAQDALEAQQEAILNAAKRCKAERASMGVSAFNEKYGPADHPNKRNAFGKCVSKYAKPATTQ